MEDISKKIVTRHFPLSELFKNNAYIGDIVINIGGFVSSSVSPLMQDASLAFLKERTIRYEEFRVLTRPFPWLRLLIPNIEQFEYRDAYGVDFFEIPLIEEKNIKIVIFKCPIFSSNATQIIEKAIVAYKKDKHIESNTYFMFGNSTQNWPWCQILLTNIKEFVKAI